MITVGGGGGGGVGTLSSTPDKVMALVLWSPVLTTPYQHLGMCI